MWNCKKCGRLFKRIKAEYLCPKCKSEKIKKRSKVCKKVLELYYKNIEKKRKYQRERYWKKHGKLLSYQHKWNGQDEREKILKRDNYRCQMCSSQEKLIIHHIDGKGVHKYNTNNQNKNRITLCVSCHRKVHGKHIKKIWQPILDKIVKHNLLKYLILSIFIKGEVAW